MSGPAIRVEFTDHTGRDRSMLFEPRVAMKNRRCAACGHSILRGSAYLASAAETASLHSWCGKEGGDR